MWEARREIFEKNPATVGLYVYKCKCGKWHLGRRFRRKR